MKNRQASTRLCLAAVALALYLGSTAILVLALPSPRDARPLHPFVTVLTDLDHAAAADALLDAGATDVITPQTTEVYVSRFRTVERVPLPVALQRLDPLDPRRDPWIARLPHYFTIEGRNAVYARFSGSLPASRRAVRRALGDAARVAEWSPWRSAGAVGLYLVAAGGLILVCFRYRRRLAPAVLPAAVTAALPWVPAVVLGGIAAVAPATVLLCFVIWVAAEASALLAAGPTGSQTTRRHSRPAWSRTLTLRFVGLGAAVLVSSLYLATVSGAEPVFALFVALVGSVAGPIAVLLSIRASYDAGHRPFEPLSIIPGRLSAVVGRPWARAGAFIIPFLVALPPLVDVTAPSTGLSPVPRVVAASGFAYDALAELSEARTDRGLPDIADYLSHRAYQEGLLYGRGFGFPGRNEVVALERFRQEADGSYAGFSDPVLVFDAAWFATALEDPPAGIASMLVGIGRPAGVVLSPADTIYSDHSRVLQHITYVVLVLAPFLLAAFSRARPVRRSPVLELARRRRQVA